MIYLGTAVTGMFMLPLLYIWAREAGGRRAGLVALLICLVGSDTNFNYSVDPRGGYMTMMTLGMLVVYLAARIALLNRNGQRVSIFYYLGLGFAAGLGWWSNQLIVVFFATAIVILLVGFCWRMVREGFLPALLAFFAGSAPWWIWNVRHEWATFDFSSHLGKVSLLHGIKALAGSLLKCFELSDLGSLWNNACLFVLISAIILFLIILICDWIKGENSGLFFFRLAAPVLILALVMASVTSRYILFSGNTRYFFPAIPALAVIAGVSIDWLLQKTRLPFLWLLVIFLIPKNTYLLPHMGDGMAPNRENWQNAIRIADKIAPQCDGVCIGEYEINWVTFASSEKLCVASIPWERYAPYAKRAELSEKTAVLNNCFGFRSFLAYTGAKSKQVSVGSISADYCLTPPPDDWRYVDESAIVSAGDERGTSCLETLVDPAKDSAWTVTLKPGETNSLTFEFDRPRQLCGIRFIAPDGNPPGCFSIDGKTTVSGLLESILPQTKGSGYFWSGPYVKLEGPQIFEETRFASLTGGVVCLRLAMVNNNNYPSVIRLNKMLFMEQAPSPADKLPSVKECMGLLRLKGVKQFFGPRWMIERLASEPGGEIAMNVPSFISRSVQDLIRGDSEKAPEISFSETTGLLMDKRDAEHSRTVLKEAGRSWEESLLGAHILLVVLKGATENDWINHPAVYWTEQGCFLQERSVLAKKKADFIFRQVIARRRTGNFTGQIKDLERALSFYPQHQPARLLLAEALESSGEREAAAGQRAELARQAVPGKVADIRFPGNVELLGITISTGEVVRGQSVDITYFWKCPPAVDVASLGVFVHFINGDERFQDDHVLMEDVSKTSRVYQPFSEVFKYVRRVQAPASVPAGKYKMVVGLFERKSNQRLKPATDLGQERRAVELPVVLSVKP